MPQTNKQEPPAREIASARKTITEQDRQLADNAFTQFKAKDFDSCLQQLKRLTELRTHDARVTANKAVVEYYASNLSKTDEFSKQLSAAKKQLEFGMVNTGDELDDIDRSFLLYNQAVIYFHVKQYKTAINILERLFKIIEPLGDLLAAKVCVLLVEVYLLNYQLEQAYGMITFIESVLLSPKTHNNDEPRSKGRNSFIIEAFQPKIHMFKVRLYLMKALYSQCRRELKFAMNSSNNSAEALFLKSHVECIRRNYQKSIKLLNSAPKTSHFMETGRSLEVMYYNNMSCLHFAMRKYHLAVLYARKAMDENISVMKALPPMEKYNMQSGRPLQTLAINKRAEIVYNLGISLLFANKPSEAFDFLMEAQSVYQCNPRFWLRLAECCIAVAQQLRISLESSGGKKNEYVRGVTGAGSHRKIVLSPFRHHLAQLRQEGQSAAMPAATLDFANLCLNNALLLLPPEQELEANMTTFLRTEKTVPGDDDKDAAKRSFLGRIYVDAPPGDPMQTKEIYHLKGSILCCHAFVALGLGDYYKSLDYSRTLLRMTHMTAPQKYVAHMYLAESLIKLDKISEAIQELSPQNYNLFATFEHDIQSLQYMQPFPKNLNEARSTMLLNLSSTYSLRSEYEKCKQCLKKIVSAELPSAIRSHAILMSVYCDLQIGHIPSALNLIKRNEVFHSGRLIDRVEAARALSNMQQMPQALAQQIPMNDFANRRPIQLPHGFQQGISGGGMPSTSGITAGGISFPPPGNLTQNLPAPPSALLQNSFGFPSAQAFPPDLPSNASAHQLIPTLRPTV